MSKNFGSRLRRQPQKHDTRARRTRDRLGNAFLGLIQEKPVERVTIQDVLDRAGIGRSTFYLHFRDKNDLLLSQFERFLEHMSTTLITSNEVSDRVVPVAEMFAHIREQDKIFRTLCEAGRINDFYDLALGYFARGIEQRLRTCTRARNLELPDLAPRAAAQAGALLSLFRWWLDRGAKQPPEEMDRLFHCLVWTGMR